MAQTDRAYVADVTISVADAQGREVLRVKSDGPLFYAKLPAGRYQVSATTARGETVSKAVDLTGPAKRKVGLRWSPEGPIA